MKNEENYNEKSSIEKILSRLLLVFGTILILYGIIAEMSGFVSSGFVYDVAQGQPNISDPSAVSFTGRSSIYLGIILFIIYLVIFIPLKKKRQ